jgi:hypothetical protein
MIYAAAFTNDNKVSLDDFMRIMRKMSLYWLIIKKEFYFNIMIFHVYLIYLRLIN